MSPRRDGGPNRSPQLTVVAVIFGGAGVIALIVALVATQAAVAVFGVIALVIAGATYGAQQVRERSAVETEETLGFGPILSPAERSGFSEPQPDFGAAPMDEEPEPDEESQAPPQPGSWDDDERREAEPTISEEDDGTGARPGNQARADVGAATATDIDADPETGRSYGEATTTGTHDEEVRPPDDEDDDEDAPVRPPGGRRVDLTPMHTGGSDDVRDAEIVDDEDRRAEPAERSAEARSGDGAG